MQLSYKHSQTGVVLLVALVITTGIAIIATISAVVFITKEDANYNSNWWIGVVVIFILLLII